MRRESAIIRKMFPVLNKGKLNFKGDKLLPVEWSFIVAFYEHKETLGLHASFADFERSTLLTPHEKEKLNKKMTEIEVVY